MGTNRNGSIANVDPIVKSKLDPNPLLESSKYDGIEEFTEEVVSVNNLNKNRCNDISCETDDVVKIIEENKEKVSCEQAVMKRSKTPEEHEAERALFEETAFVYPNDMPNSNVKENIESVEVSNNNEIAVENNEV